MGERFGPARVQYGDWHGSVALDNPDDDANLYRLAGISRDEWWICGLEINSASESAAGVSGSVLAVRRELIKERADWEKVARANGGNLPTTEFVLREGITMAVLGEFKRADIRVLAGQLSDVGGIGLEVSETVYPPE
jgi:hypothetical protein